MSETRSAGLGGEAFTFALAALPDLEFHVAGFGGGAALNGLYRFTIRALARTRDLASLGPRDFYSGAAVLGLREPGGGGTKPAPGGSSAWAGDWHGTLTAARLGREAGEWTVCDFVLEPGLSKLRGQIQSRIHLDAAVPSIVRESMLFGGADPGGVRLDLDESAYPAREFVLQHREDLLGFAMRLLEREGVSLRFDQSGGRDVAVLSDSNSRFPPLLDGGGEIELEISDVSGMGPESGAAALYGASFESRLPKRKLRLRDYDWKRPERPLEVELEVSARGRGELYLYGENFRTQAEGERIASIRREEELWASERLTGWARLPGAMPGLTVGLRGGAPGDLGGRWLIASVEARGSQAGLLSAGLGLDARDLRGPGPERAFPDAGQAPGPGDGLECFAALGRLRLPYRPARKTPVPRIEGPVAAWIDGEGTGEKPELDVWGRYKVLFPFDLSGRPNGGASPWIRMSQPSAGPGSGQHFPLRPGCEVQVAFTGGDPDRPVITGAVADGETGSFSNAATPAASGIGTRGGGALVFGENQGKQSATLSGGSGRGAISLSSGSPSVCEISADMVDRVTAFLEDTSFFNSMNSAGRFYAVRASAGWARTFALVMAAIREGLGTASDLFSDVPDSAKMGDTAKGVTSDALSLASLACSPLQNVIQWIHDVGERKKKATAPPDWRGTPDDGLFETQADWQGSSSVWRANSDFAGGGWNSQILKFLMLMKSARDVGSAVLANTDPQADGRVTRKKADGTGGEQDKKGGALKIASRTALAGSSALTVLTDVLVLLRLWKSVASPSGRKPTGMVLNNALSYVTVLAKGHAAFSAKGALLLESGGSERLGDDLRFPGPRDDARLSRLAALEDGTSAGTGLEGESAVLLRGELIRSVGRELSLTALDAVAVKSAGVIRVATGPNSAEMPAQGFFTPAPEGVKADLVEIPKGPEMGRGVSLEALEDGSVARVCCLDEDGAVLLLQGSHRGELAEAGKGKDGGRRLELSKGGALIQDGKEHALTLSASVGAELRSGTDLSFALKGGQALAKAGDDASLAAGNGTVSAAGTQELKIEAASGQAKITMGSSGFVAEANLIEVKAKLLDTG
ncbi:MAG: type VI secretion system tip protein VgrG [Deltaproteobacteria bacterium]|jgi:Rhs element Vgr protein|nr:type VI secretion system tip protein VgrG [Deltaproteobacteria bacterium]